MPTELTEVPVLQGLSGSAIQELRQLVRSTLSAPFEDFVQQLPKALNERINKLPMMTERRVYQDMARRIGINADGWRTDFLKQVDSQMVGGVAVRSAEASASDEENIALANLELKAEARYQRLIMELDARLNRVRLTLYIPLYTRALAPAGLCRSLHETASAMGWPANYRRILFEQFDSTVIAQLEDLYRSLVEAIKRIGSQAEKEQAQVAENAPAPAAPPRVQQANLPQVDGETAAMLRRHAMGGDGEGYTDSLLAADLLALMDHRPLPGLKEDQSWVPLQRITLAGKFLNETVNDPLVPADLKPQHEAVRLPLIKSALTDPGLFTDVSHPLRSLVNELMLKAATSRITGSSEGKRSVDNLQAVLVNFNLAPDFVRQALGNAKPIADSQIARFFELQRQQAEQRRDFVIAEAKRVVGRELEQITFGRNVPPSAIRFLNKAWGALLTRRLLQHGALHASYRNALAQLETLVDQLEARQPGVPAPSEWRDLVRSMGAGLVSEGISGQALTEALSLLEAARLEPL